MSEQERTPLNIEQIRRTEAVTDETFAQLQEWCGAIHADVGARVWGLRTGHRFLVGELLAELEARREEVERLSAIVASIPDGWLRAVHTGPDHRNEKPPLGQEAGNA